MLRSMILLTGMYKRQLNSRSNQCTGYLNMYLDALGLIVPFEYLRRQVTYPSEGKDKNIGQTTRCFSL